MGTGGIPHIHQQKEMKVVI
ncbi:hypothetical protein LINPERPRIM_LOCUS31747 [Linum perenne]